ncbi:hypothetical protein DITRI_Ditri07aG0005200 [Diplodiscus trichospermus]
MARVPCKHILLVAFVLLSFISATPRARSFPNAGETDQKCSDEELLTATQGGAPNVDEMVAMDYTPARRKPPIHN